MASHVLQKFLRHCFRVSSCGFGVETASETGVGVMKGGGRDHLGFRFAEEGGPKP